LTRAQQQERTRATVLAAARQEFSERGYAGTTVDRIAGRADLTRGAVYSNFPSKRAMYLEVLLAEADEPVWPARSEASTNEKAAALAAFARAWLERLPLTVDAPAAGRLRLRSLSGVLDDADRAVLAEVGRLEALLLGHALESCLPRGTRTVRRVRLAELVLTMLAGSGHLAETAPGFGDAFDVVRACEHLAGLDLADAWDPPHLTHVGPARTCRDPWTPPADRTDLVTGHPVDLNEDGVVAVLGTGRLAAAEEAVRAARPGDAVTVVITTNDPAETGGLVRLRIGDLTGCLRRAFAPEAAPDEALKADPDQAPDKAPDEAPDAVVRLRLVLDDDGRTAAAAGVPDPGDACEAAVRVRAGRIIARARGRGAAHAAATYKAGR
jgi:AcrR family transcriptional regulator